MVSRVNWSPAREPKGLEPPAPPRAPINPPPLPRWIRIKRIRNGPRISRMTFNKFARIAMTATSLGGSQTHGEENYYRSEPTRRKADFGLRVEMMGRRGGGKSLKRVLRDHTSPTRKRGDIAVNAVSPRLRVGLVDVQRNAGPGLSVFGGASSLPRVPSAQLNQASRVGSAGSLVLKTSCAFGMAFKSSRSARTDSLAISLA